MTRLNVMKNDKESWDYTNPNPGASMQGELIYQKACAFSKYLSRCSHFLTIHTTANSVNSNNVTRNLQDKIFFCKFVMKNGELQLEIVDRCLSHDKIGY